MVQNHPKGLARTLTLRRRPIWG